MQKAYKIPKIFVAVSFLLVVSFNNCSGTSFQSITALNESSHSSQTGPPFFTTPTPPPVAAYRSASRAILVGYGGRIMQTFDSGKTYTQDHSDEAAGGDDLYLIRNAKYLNGVFVAVGFRIMTSTDGQTWKQKTLTQWLGGIAYGNGTWVLAGGCGSRWYSKDNAATWFEVANDFIGFNGCGHLRDVKFGNGIFFAAGDHGLTATSSDGVTWTVYTPTASSPLFAGISFAYGYFYAYTSATSGSNLYRSIDGAMWEIDPDIQDNVSAITFSNKTLIVTGSQSLHMTTDGTTWTESKTAISGQVYALADGYIRLAWQTIGFSPDLTTWTNMGAQANMPSVVAPVE